MTILILLPKQRTVSQGILYGSFNKMLQKDQCCSSVRDMFKLLPCDSAALFKERKKIKAPHLTEPKQIVSTYVGFGALGKQFGFGKEAKFTLVQVAPETYEEWNFQSTSTGDCST